MEIEREDFMEYTKDMILGGHYGEVHKVVKSKGTSWKYRLLKIIKTHKIATTAVISAIVFISIDIVLISNFVQILSLV